MHGSRWRAMNRVRDLSSDSCTAARHACDCSHCCCESMGSHDCPVILFPFSFLSLLSPAAGVLCCSRHHRSRDMITSLQSCRNEGARRQQQSDSRLARAPYGIIYLCLESINLPAFACHRETPSDREEVRHERKKQTDLLPVLSVCLCLCEHMVSRRTRTARRQASPASVCARFPVAGACSDLH